MFKLNPDGLGFTVLKDFDYYTTGGYLSSGELIQGADGAIYGTAPYGGPAYAGTIFKLNTSGTGFTILKSFGEDETSGTYPFSR